MRFSPSFCLALVVCLISTFVVGAPYPAQPTNEVVTNENSVPVVVNQTSELWEKSQLGRRASKPIQPSWILGRFSDSKILTEEDRKVFSSELKDLKLDSRLNLADPALNNGGIWTVKEYKTYHGDISDLLVKIMPDYSTKHSDINHEQSDNLNFGEVKALKHVGDFVAAGLIKDPERSVTDRLKDKAKSLKGDKPHMYPVVVMKKKQGNTLSSFGFYRSANRNGQVMLAREVKKLTCTEVARVAVAKRALHGDRNLGNALVTFNGIRPISVQLIDWGIAFLVSEGTKFDDVFQYCMKTTKFFNNKSVDVRRAVVAETSNPY
ncbi:hypothetical protein GYMLUDRAFT_48191 [Collybiopsis luxurians FD-317 M1]|uniref:Protein kinase domain-containing protein n=1 Tax=Collybiopsis luxurians FD-317 M1 TaxID=944289 RepID=A0A0D0CJ58_9AGAR|nr:hypothetical protein GYMLUDRAFT_48191 [Collybiopsis luxurians FD-317 M1]